MGAFEKKPRILTTSPPRSDAASPLIADESRHPAVPYPSHLKPFAFPKADTQRIFPPCCGTARTAFATMWKPVDQHGAAGHWFSCEGRPGIRPVVETLRLRIPKGAMPTCLSLRHRQCAVPPPVCGAHVTSTELALELTSTHATIPVAAWRRASPEGRIPGRPSHEAE